MAQGRSHGGICNSSKTDEKLEEGGGGGGGGGWRIPVLSSMA
jgi:hypothetical protein